MGLTLFVGGQEGVTWSEWQAIAAACQDNGLEGLFTSDHYMPIVTDDDRGALSVGIDVRRDAAHDVFNGRRSFSPGTGSEDPNA